MKFEWDKNKNISNKLKHGLSFEDAVGLFLGDHIRIELESQDENRWAAIGKISGKCCVAVYTARNGKIRLISVRRARKDEEAYHKKIF